MRFIKTFFFLSLFLVASAQQIDKEFSKLAFEETFSQTNGLWQQTNNGEDLFITQGDKYLMIRKHKQTPALILSSQPNKFSACRIVTTFNFEKNINKRQSFGMILMAQENGTGALIVELNYEKEMRILKYNGSTFRALSLDDNKEGWVKVPSMLPDAENTLSIVSNDRLYDIYVNNTFVQNFSDLDFAKGQLGFYIGPDSRAAINTVQVFTEADDESYKENQGTVTGTDKALTEIVISLRKQVNNQKKDISVLTKSLENCRQKNFTDSSNKASTAGLRSQVTTLTASNKKLSTENDTLKKQNARLKDFQQTIRKSDNGDLLINLTTSYQDEKEKNKKLEEKNKAIEEKNKALEAENKKLQAELARLKANKSTPKK